MSLPSSENDPLTPLNDRLVRMTWLHIVWGMTKTFLSTRRLKTVSVLPEMTLWPTVGQTFKSKCWLNKLARLGEILYCWPVLFFQAAHVLSDSVGKVTTYLLIRIYEVVPKGLLAFLGFFFFFFAMQSLVPVGHFRNISGHLFTWLVCGPFQWRHGLLFTDCIVWDDNCKVTGFKGSHWIH